MFHVKVKLKESDLHGIGLFADQHIKKGQAVYTINESLDLKISIYDFELLSNDEQQTICHYGYLDKSGDYWHLSFDDVRFCNHSRKGNIKLVGNRLIAKRDISKGEELTQNYSEFENLRRVLKD